MTLVVVGHRAAASLLDRQARLRPVQSLHRALFVDAEHYRVLRRIQIQPHHVVQFLLKSWVVADLEGPDQVWFQTMRLPHTVDKAVRRPHRPGHRACRPVRRVLRRRLRRCLNNPSPQLRLSLGVLAAVIPAARTLLLNTLHTFLHKTVAPPTYRVLVDPQCLRDGLIRHARACHQHDLRALDQSDRGASS